MANEVEPAQQVFRPQVSVELHLAHTRCLAWLDQAGDNTETPDKMRVRTCLQRAATTSSAFSSYARILAMCMEMCPSKTVPPPKPFIGAPGQPLTDATILPP